MNVIYNGKIIGEIITGEYHTRRTSEHFCRKYRGFGISVPIIEILKNNKVEKIFIHYDGKRVNKTFWAELNIWETLGKKDQLGEYEQQLFLSVEFMTEK